MSGSVSFDRVAALYDSTRVTDEQTLRGVVDLLEREVATDGGEVLEIGVGTGAIAVPLSARGVHVVGIDLSDAMMGHIAAKGGGVSLAAADATRLPFGSAVFAGSYARWVLHLIPAWRSAVAELCRVTAPGGVIAIEPGGFAGRWREVMDRMVEAIGPAAAPVGLSHDRQAAELEAAFVEEGTEPMGVFDIPGHFAGSLGSFFDEALARTYSWTWRASDEDLARGVATVRAWAEERFDDWDTPLDLEAPMHWHRYRVSGST